jgi:hypothetical protein
MALLPVNYLHDKRSNLHLKIIVVCHLKIRDSSGEVEDVVGYPVSLVVILLKINILPKHLFSFV